MTSFIILAISAGSTYLLWQTGVPEPLFSMPAARLDRLASLFEDTAPVRTMAAFHRSYSTLSEEQILNIIWVAILGLEIMMVLGIAVKSVVRHLSYSRITSGPIAL
ncbi:aimless RasGEF [Purpureocillium lavendulum]|uniref:Aimless RasGEF n=1 Tax=Purpureocillium lavendulum TaxID=1247861 RepID=A0AB34FKX2_9HYPO|nr:aimless RasGEF [Purpureocillium lavendulum]